jgi:hypothetical protein
MDISFMTVTGILKIRTALIHNIEEQKYIANLKYI